MQSEDVKEAAIKRRAERLDRLLTALALIGSGLMTRERHVRDANTASGRAARRLSRRRVERDFKTGLGRGRAAAESEYNKPGTERCDMAVLQEQASKSNNPFLELIKDDIAPSGTWQATIIDIKDQFGVVRPSFENPQQTEVVDITTFLFGFRDQAGQPHRIASKTMRISGNEKSTLFGFLKAALGCPPKYGWDYCELKGKRCLITVAHEPKRNGQGVYPTIAALCPVPAGMGVPGGNAQPAIGNVQPVQAPASAPANAQPAAGSNPGPAAAAADDEPLPF